MRVLGFGLGSRFRVWSGSGSMSDSGSFLGFVHPTPLKSRFLREKSEANKSLGSLEPSDTLSERPSPLP